MIRNFLILILFFFSAFLQAKSNEEEPQKETKIVYQMLNDINDLVLKNKNPKDKAIYPLVQETLSRLNSGELGIVIDNQLPDSLVGGATFNVYEDKTSRLHFSPGILRIYSKNPSLVLAMFVHEAQHSKNYFDNPSGFLLGRTSALEKYLYELDAFNREALFLIYYIKENQKYRTTAFENLLANSFDKDKLHSFSYIALGHDADLAAYLYQIPDFEMTYEEKIDKLKEGLNSLQTLEIDPKAKPFDRYAKLVPIYSFLQFSPQAIRNIDSIHNKIKGQNSYSLSEQEPELYQELLKLEAKFVKHIEDYKYQATLLEEISKLD